MLAINKRRFAVAPMRSRSTELLFKVDFPNDASGLDIQSHERTVGGLRIEPAAVNCGCTPRAVAALLAVRPAGGRLPKLLPGARVEGHHVFLASTLPLRVELSLSDRESRKPLAESAGFPNLLGAVRRPGAEESGFRRDAVSLRPAPLRPVGGHDWEGQTGQEDNGLHKRTSLLLQYIHLAIW